MRHFPEGISAANRLTVMKHGFQRNIFSYAIAFSNLLIIAPGAAFAVDTGPDVQDSVNSATFTGRSATMLAPAALETSGAVIGSINIANQNIFDLERPDEDRALFRLANRLHVTTRPAVIKNQLLFEPGARFSGQAIAESERIIRANRYIQKVSIVPVRQQNGVVDINVENL